MKRNWNKIADICETVIVILLAILVLAMAITQSDPVTWLMPVEEQKRTEQMILGR